MGNCNYKHKAFVVLGLGCLRKSKTLSVVSSGLTENESESLKLEQMEKWSAQVTPMRVLEKLAEQTKGNPPK